MPLHMRTTVDLPEALLQRAKQIAEARSVPVQVLIEEGLRDVIERYSPPQTFELEDCSFGVGGLVDDLEPGDWPAIRERAYEGRGG